MHLYDHLCIPTAFSFQMKSLLTCLCPFFTFCLLWVFSAEHCLCEDLSFCLVIVYLWTQNTRWWPLPFVTHLYKQLRDKAFDAHFVIGYSSTFHKYYDSMLLIVDDGEEATISQLYRNLRRHFEELKQVLQTRTHTQMHTSHQDDVNILTDCTVFRREKSMKGRKWYRSRKGLRKRIKMTCNTHKIQHFRHYRAI